MSTKKKKKKNQTNYQTQIKKLKYCYLIFWKFGEKNEISTYNLSKFVTNFYSKIVLLVAKYLYSEYHFRDSIRHLMGRILQSFCYFRPN